MRIQNFILILLLSGATSATAFPIAPMNSSPANTNCQRGDQVSDFRGLIHRVAVYEQDDRTPLSKTVVKLSPEQAEQAMRCTGYIYCPNAENGQPKTFSAGAVCSPGSRDAQGKCAADRIGTVAHGFINHSSLRLNDNLARCEFRNYRGHRSALEVNDVRTINASEVMDPRTGPQNRAPRTLEDKTVVRLKRPIPGCDPYDIAQQEEIPRKFSDLIAITFKQADMSMSQSDGSEPLVYPCSVTRVFRSGGGQVGAFYGDCDLNPGGSGGFALVRNANNQLVVAGIFSGSNVKIANFKKYDESLDNFTAITATSPDFVMMAKNPSQRPSIQAGQSNSPSTPKPTNN